MSPVLLTATFAAAIPNIAYNASVLHLDELEYKQAVKFYSYTV